MLIVKTNPEKKITQPSSRAQRVTVSVESNPINVAFRIDPESIPFDDSLAKSSQKEFIIESQ